MRMSNLIQSLRRWKMGKRSRRLKAVAKASSANPASSVPGGILGAQHRARNGQATMQDVGFLLRLSREMKGRDGYSGESKGSRGTFVSSDHSISKVGEYDWNRGSGYSFHTQSTPKAEDGVFHCKESNEVTASCPLNPPIPSILIESAVWDCFMNCAKEFDTEWIALLIGKLDKDSKGEPAYLIERFYFPPQVASGAHVEVPTGVKPKPGTIGAIHSHVGMGVFWSATDTAHSNWPVEIVINRKEEYEALSRYQLKCGEWAKSKAKVYLTGSFVNATIKGMMEKAFSLGKELDKGKGSLVNVHEDDKGDVAEAIVPISAGAGIPAVGDANYFCPTCKSKWKTEPVDNCKDSWHSSLPTSPAEEVCPVLNCVREKGHKGYCRNSGNDYFPGPDFQTKGGKGASQGTQVEISFDPTSDDPTDLSSELASDEMCQDCEGIGLIESTQGGMALTAITCPSCHGDGLSELGRVRAKEDKDYSQFN